MYNDVYDFSFQLYWPHLYHWLLCLYCSNHKFKDQYKIQIQYHHSFN